MGHQSILVAAQLSAITAPAQTEEVVVGGAHRGSASLGPLPTDSPADHAVYASVFHTDRTGTVLLRVIDGGLTIELVSLGADLPPVRFVFPALLLPNPGIFDYGPDEVHVIAVTEHGEIYRLVIPVTRDGGPWRQPFAKTWTREYTIKNTRGAQLSGLVQVQGPTCVAVGLKDGTLLRIESDAVGNEDEEDMWREHVFAQGSSLSFLTSFVHLPHSGHTEFISMTSHAQPTDNGRILTLSRDRTIRLWSERAGCVAACTLPVSSSAKMVASRGQTPAIESPSAALLEGGPQNFLRLVTRETERDEWTWAFVFSPTPSATHSGGFFHVLGVTRGHLSSHASFECSTNTAYCSLQDFAIAGNTLYALWDRQGTTTVEKIALVLERTGAGVADGALWQPASYVPEPELTPNYIDQLLLAPGSLTDHLLTAITKPGTFSPLTLRTAIKQYTDHYLGLPSQPPIQLQSAYATLPENIAAVVGCTVVLSRDLQTGALEHDKYWQALRRDWEGFIARCREIERSARRPLAIGVVRNDVLLVERERAGVLAAEDIPIQLYRCLDQNVPINGHDTLFDIIWKLRAQLSVEILAELEARIVALVQRDMTAPLVDHVFEEARQMQFEACVDDGFAEWLRGRLDGLETVDGAVRNVLNTLGQFDKEVKQEEDEVALMLPQANAEWTHALAVAYALASVEARCDFALALLALLFFLAPDLSTWEPSIVAEAFAVFRGLAMLRVVARRPGADPAVTQTRPGAEDIAARMRALHVRGRGGPAPPTYALLHQLLAQHGFGVEPANAAHRFLDNTGLVRGEAHAAVYPLEVLFCERLRLLGYHQVAQELLAWLPSTPAVTYVRGRLCLDTGRPDEAAELLEMVGGSIGKSSYLAGDDLQGLANVLPDAELPESEVFYYYGVVELFKHAGETRWAVHFAELILAEADDELDVGTMWTEVFRGYLDLALYDDAYSTLVNIPGDEDQKSEHVSTLVYRMCEDNATEKLMTFNFVTMSKIVEDALVYKVRALDPRTRPFYSRILYSWYVGRNDYRNAAMVMYQRGRKLAIVASRKEEMIPVAEEQRQAYVIALNALGLLDEKNAWFVVDLPGDDSPDHTRKRKKLRTHIPEDQFAPTTRQTEYVDAAQIQRELVFLTTRIDLLRRDPSLLDIGGAALTSEGMVERLTHAGRFDTALAAALSLEVDMTTIFSRLAQACLLLSRRVPVILEEETADWLLTDKVSSWPGTPADRGWRYVRQMLERYDGPKTQWRYSQTVLEVLLATNRQLLPPPWLVTALEEHQPESLIRAYFRFENWESTLEYSLVLIRKTQAHLAKIPPEHAMATWLPYTLIDQVVEAARDQPTLSARAQTLRTELDTELANHVKRMQKLSQFKA